MEDNHKNRDIYLSVIIPAYNVEKYIAKCLESVIRQQIFSMEVFIINDGSTDKTEEIANLFVSKHRNVKLITIKNRGVAHARNIGLKLARGKYITFVDSDDYLADNMYSIMLHEMRQYNVDIVECSCVKEGLNGNALERRILKKEIIVGKYNCLKHFLEQDNCCNYMCNKIYNRKLFRNNEFPTLQYSEDYYMNVLLHKNAKSKIIINNILYHYVIHNQNACEKKIGIERMDIIRAGALVADLITNRTLIVFPCVYTCDYYIKIAKILYEQKNIRLFYQFIYSSKNMYLKMFRHLSPKKLQQIKHHQKYWLYIFFIFFPYLGVHLTK